MAKADIHVKVTFSRAAAWVLAGWGPFGQLLVTVLVGFSAIFFAMIVLEGFHALFGTTATLWFMGTCVLGPVAWLTGELIRSLAVQAILGRVGRVVR